MTTAKKQELKLGMIVQDKASGLKGMLTARHELLFGSTQYAIQPKGKGHDYPESRLIDEQQIKIISKGESAGLPSEDDTVEILLGEEVEDRITGFKGTTEERVVFMNGCVFFNMTTKMHHSKENGAPECKTHFINGRKLKRVGFGVSKEEPRNEHIFNKVEPYKPEKARRPGGPSRPNTYSQR